MAGTKEGAAKAKAKLLAKDPDFFVKIGAKGGRNGHTGGFYANPKLASIAGRKGGHISRRGKKTDPKEEASSGAYVSENLMGKVLRKFGK